MTRYTHRPALVVGLVASGGLHAAVLVFGAIDVPTQPAADIRLVRPAIPLAARLDPEERAHVVVIRPPGMMPSGGSAGHRGGTGHRAGAASRSGPMTASAPAPSPRRAPIVRAELAFAAPVPEARGLPIPPLATDSASSTPTTRPGRGVVLRTGPPATSGGGGAPSGRGGSGGSGGLGAGGGVTAAGPGGDCITPGIATPAIPSQGSPALPRRAPGRSGSRAPRPGGPPPRSSG